MKYLLVGGAGYIGSHVARELARAGHNVTILDDLSKGHRGKEALIGLHKEKPLIRQAGSAAAFADSPATGSEQFHY